MAATTRPRPRGDLLLPILLHKAIDRGVLPSHGLRAHVQAADRKKLAVAGATGSKVMKLNIAMQYLTENSRFAGKPLDMFVHSSGHVACTACCKLRWIVTGSG